MTEDAGRFRLLVLYTRLAPYFYACVQRLVESYPVDVEIIRYQPDPNAPLRFDSSEHIKIVDLGDVSDDSLRRRCHDPRTRLILTSGWREKRYRKALRGTTKPSVVMVDNPYRGTIRQRVAGLFASKVLARCFSHAWITGHQSYELVRRLGFSAEQILDGLYVAAENSVEVDA